MPVACFLIVCLVASAAAADGSKCRMDMDCPGDLLCERHLCVNPANGPPPVPAAPKQEPDAQVPLAPPPPEPELEPLPPPPLMSAPLVEVAPAAAPPAQAPAAEVPAVAVPPESPRVADGYKGAKWGLRAQEFQQLKAVAPGAVSPDLLSPSPNEPTGIWSDAVAVLLGAPVEKESAVGGAREALLFQAMPPRFASAYVPADEADYLFFEGQLVGALVRVEVRNYETLKAELRKRYKPRGVSSRKVPLREGHEGGSLTADAFANRSTRVFLCRLQHPLPGAGDLVTSLRLLYFSGADFENIRRAIERGAERIRKSRAPRDRGSSERDLDKLQ